jgi:predicted DNA-binding transcriptional regulator AlpA
VLHYASWRRRGGNDDCLCHRPPANRSKGSRARLLSIVPSTLWSWHSAGKLPAPIRLGGRTLWRRAELEAWVAAGCPSRERWETFREGAR